MLRPRLMKNLMRYAGPCFGCLTLFLFLLSVTGEVCAIVINPTPRQIDQALERGTRSAQTRTPPDRLYSWFGSNKDLEPHGFLMTKLDGLAVTASHFSLRSEEPKQDDVDRILQEPALLISLILFGEHPAFAVDSYVLIKQGEQTLIPEKIRFDGRAKRSSRWPASPEYQAKVIATFSYATLDPLAITRIEVITGEGKEVSFELDFRQFQ